MCVLCWVGELFLLLYLCGVVWIVNLFDNFKYKPFDPLQCLACLFGGFTWVVLIKRMDPLILLSASPAFFFSFTCDLEPCFILCVYLGNNGKFGANFILYPSTRPTKSA